MTATHSFPRPRTVLLAAAAAAALGSVVLLPAFAQPTGGDPDPTPTPTTGDAIKPAYIATEPLYSHSSGDRPAMVLAPSVEFPTVGAQYRGTDNYSAEDEYIGYYNAEKCYTYRSGGTTDDKYFEITSSASSRKCSGDYEFSGNFLNWATSSSMDMMRLALTGGDRVVDTTSKTVLQRAYLPDGTANNSDGGPGCFFNNPNHFPGKTLTAAQAVGAVPVKMREAAGSSTIHIGNMANRIYFGTTQGGEQDCTAAPQSYNLGPSFSGASGSSTAVESLPAGTFKNEEDEEPPGSEECADAMKWHGDGADAKSNAGEVIAARLKNEKACKPFPNDPTKRYRLWYGKDSDGWLTGVFTGQVACTFEFEEWNNRAKCDLKLKLKPQGKEGPDCGWGDKGEQYFKMLFPGFTSQKIDRLDDYECFYKEEEGDDNFFYARVKVCDASDERDYGLCTEYPNNGNPIKKPTGVIQKYADNLRLAVFGYAIDHTQPYNGDQFNGRFGALLRAPMKYVGPRTYSSTGVQQDAENSRKEWDTETGILVRDPEGLYSGAQKPNMEYPDKTDEMAAEDKVSGVINYFNRFGRNPRQPGAYKQYDPVSELYYEALRYMQGLEATPQAVSNLTDYMIDGFPAYKSWAGLDPFDTDLGYKSDGDYTCLKSSILIIGDVNVHDTERRPAKCAKDTPDAECQRYTLKKGVGAAGGWNASENVPDAVFWRNVVRGFETKGSKTYKDGSGNEHTTSMPGSKNFETSSGGIYLWSVLPGLAYWAHTHDIRGEGWDEAKQRPGLRVTTYTFDVNEGRGKGYEYKYNKRIGKVNTFINENGEGEVVGYGNQYWLAAKYGGFVTTKAGCSTVANDDGSKTETCTGAYNTHNPFYGMKCITTTYPDGRDPTETCTDEPADPAVWSDLSKAQGNNTNGNTNPEPRTYYMPSNARGTLKAFDDIFGSQQPPGNRSIAGADSSGGLGKGTSFQAEFDGSDWSGDVIAESIVVSGQKNELRANSALPDHTARKIFMGTSTHSVPRAFEFKADSVPTDVSSALDGDIDGVDADAADRINWLRGDRSKEGSPLRKRTRLLGDIVNSGVKYVGAPAGQVNLGLGYDAFVDAQTFRRAAVYVGANDGMLHAFHAGGKEEVPDPDRPGQTKVQDAAPTLAELFAYIPSWMKGKLAALTDPGYKHQLYVDATPVIGDANLNGACTTVPAADATTLSDTDCDWRSVLVGGTGGGGKGVYALDVTNPEAFAANKVLWEFTDADDPDMGYVLGQARIVKLLYTEADAATNTPAVYRWFAMVPAGVNNYVGADNKTPTSGNGNANIFLLALDKPSNVGWGAANTGGYYWKLELPRDQSIQGTHPTGILNLEAFTGLGGVTEYVYAGDLHGQLWAFSFKGVPAGGTCRADPDSNNRSLWSPACLANNYTTTSGAVKPLFIARTPADADGNTKPQPITVAPTILEGAGNGVHFVSFGTGKYFEEVDAHSTKIDTFYTVYSNFNTSAEDTPNRTTTGEAIIPSRDYLQEVVWNETKTVDGASVDYFKPSQAFFWGWLANAPTAGDTPNTRSGWFMDFVERNGDTTTAVGERQIADASWIGLTSRLMFSTLTPNSATSTDVCGAGGGDSKLYTFDMISGMGTGRHSAVGMLAQPLVFLDTANATETDADSTGRRLRITPVMSGQFGADGSAVNQVDTVIVPFGRLSWRRIDNFEGLRQSGGTSNPSAAGGGNTGGGGSGDSN